MKFQKPKSHIHLIARGLLISGSKIILCKSKYTNWFFLPGGHIENGESAKSALMRELIEETGNNNYRIRSFVGICENIFPLKDGVSQHEINIVFKVDYPNKIKINAKEDHIAFVSVDKNSLKDCKILPTTIKNGILEWLNNRKPFLKEI